MRNLRNRFERFCLKHRDKGIPNLMLYIAIGSGLVYLLSQFDNSGVLYELLRFDKALILKGQIWRLVSYVFTHAPGSNLLLTLVFLYFFYNLGSAVERSMGTFRFNLYYFSGVLLMDLFAMIFCPTEAVTYGGQLIPAEAFVIAIYSNMAFYLHLSLLLIFATTNPQSQFLVFFIIPVKAWFMGLVYLLIIAFEIYNYGAYFPHNLFPLAATANYLLFAGRDIGNLFPFIRHSPRHRAAKPPHSGPIPFRTASGQQKQTSVYSHRCTVCGRTDTTNPELEFRYCSRCNGYHCYCEDHINNHSHVE